VREPLEQIVFEVTYGCNLSCEFCYNCWKAPGYPVGPELSPADYKALVRRLPKASLYAISGGEPLIRRDIFDIADALLEGCSQLSLLTNGIAMDGRAADAVAERNMAVQLPVHDLRDAHDTTVSSRGAFTGLVRACCLLRDRAMGFTTSTVASRTNISHLKDVLELCVALGSKFLLLIRFLPGGAGLGRRDLLLTRDEVVAAYGVLDDVCGYYGVPGAVGVPNLPCVIDEDAFPHVTFSNCRAGRDWFAVDPSGRLRMCNHSPTVYGKLLEHPLTELVQHDTLQAFEAGTVHPPGCEGCEHLEGCRGGCRAVAETMHGDLRGPDPLFTA
jgi:radical SAM protein with 4Fe4S-binding SPASM domain